MALWRPSQRVRVVVIGLARRDDRLLVLRVLDDSGALKGVRPPGGGVEFGERAADALAREFREELETDIAVEGSPIVVENLFDHEGARGHEIVFAFPVRLLDPTIYTRPAFTIREDNGTVLEVEWLAANGGPAQRPRGAVSRRTPGRHRLNSRRFRIGDSMASARQAQPHKRLLGVIGGSGLYEIPGLTNTRWEKVSSPFGDPSDDFLFAELGRQPVVFLPRHGRGHKHSPTTINYRANIDALKRVGVTDLLSLSAVGSFREELSPGTFVVVDQFIDRTIQRQKSFFGEGMVAHVSMAHPVCARVGDAAYQAAQINGLKVVRGGTYLAMEGPQFSSLAESELYRSWGCHVIGMTNMPEAKLAREAEICYATVAMVTDYDCWHPDHDHVQVADIVRALLENARNACDLVREFVPLMKNRPATCPHGCDRVLDTALITAPAARDPAMLKMLDAVAGRALAAQAK